MSAEANDAGEYETIADESKVATASYTDEEGGFGEGDVIPAIAQVADAFSDQSQMPAIRALIGDDQAKINEWVRYCCTFDKQGNTAVPIFHYSNRLWPWLSNITQEKADEKEREATSSYDAKAKKLLKLFFGFGPTELANLDEPMSALQLLAEAAEASSPKVKQYPVKMKGGQYGSLNDIMGLKANKENKTGGWKLKKPSAGKDNIAVPASIKVDFQELCLASYRRTLSKRNKAIKSRDRVSRFLELLREGIGYNTETQQLTWDGPWWSKVLKRVDPNDTELGQDQDGSPKYAYYNPDGSSDTAFWTGGEVQTDVDPQDTVLQAPEKMPEDDPQETEVEDSKQELQNQAQDIANAANQEKDVRDALIALKSAATDQIGGADALQSAYNAFGGSGSRKAKLEFCRIILDDSSANRFAFSTVKAALEEIISDISATEIIKLEAISKMLGFMDKSTDKLDEYIEGRKNMKESRKRKRSLASLLLEATPAELEDLEGDVIDEIQPLIASTEEALEKDSNAEVPLDDGKHKLPNGSEGQLTTLLTFVINSTL